MSKRLLQLKSAFLFFSRIARISAVIIGLAVVLSVSAGSQSYLQEKGFPSFAVAQPVTMGSIDISNGNLHIEIPLAASAQRGKYPIQAKFTYDSRMWSISNAGSSQLWVASQPWNFRQTFDQVTTVRTQFVPCGASGYTIVSGFAWNDGNGTAHAFPGMQTVIDSGSGCTLPPAVLSAYASDSSGILGIIDPFGHLDAHMPDGSIYHQSASDQTPNKFTDPNGNFFTFNGGPVVDTLARTLVGTPTVVGNTTTYPVLNSGGTTTNYSVATASFGMATAFGQPGVAEASGSGTLYQSIGLPDGTSYQFGYDSYGELSSIQLPTGGSVTFGYTNFVDSYGNVNRWATSYTMGGGTWTYVPQVISTCPTGQQNCQQKVTVTKPSGNSIVYTFTMNGGAWPVQAQYFASGGTLLLTQTHDYDLSQTCAGCNGAGYVTLTRETSSLPSTGGTILINKKEYTYDSPLHGNVTAIKEWKFYTGTPSATPDRETDIAYLNTSAYTNANIINLPVSITTKDASGTQVAQTLMTYDSTALTSIAGASNHDDANFGTGNTLRGNPTLIKRWVTGTTFLSTTLTYDTTGQVIRRTDPAGNNFTFGYADRFFNDNGANPPASFTPTTPTNAYLTSVTSPIIGTATIGYYFGSGNPASATDQNNAVSYSHYGDALDRSTLSINPTGGWALTSYSSATQTDVYSTLADVTPSMSCVSCRHDRYLEDNMGRLLTTALVNDPDGQISVGRTYDASSRVNSVTNPYRTTTEPTYGTNSASYDGMDRIIQRTLPDGNIATTTFAAAVVSATQVCGNGIAAPTVSVDEAGKKRQLWTDGFGQVIEVDEPDTGGAFSIATCSQYDALGNLVSVTQRGGTTDTLKWRTRAYVFDSLSRPTQATTPESGTTTYSYTTSTGTLCAGNPSAVCRRTDARNITTTYTYDALSRLVSKTYSDTTAAVTYSYDQAAFNGLTISNGKGRRTGMTDGSGQTAWSYDASGRVLVRQQKIGTLTKSITYTYNLNGSINTVTYPSGRVYTYSYNNAFRPVSVSDTPNNIKFASSTHFAAAGMLTNSIYGAVPGWNAITLTNTFNNRLEPTQFLATSPVPSTLLNISFGYDQGGGKNNGSIVQITNGRDSTRSVAYTYDQLNRLSTAGTNQAATWGNSYVYDAWGNLLQKNVTQGTAESMTLVVNNKNQVTSPAFTYDAAGNTTWDTVNALQFNAEGRMNPVSGLSYTYDGDGRRVQKSDGTVYWLDDYLHPLSVGTTTGSITRDYVFFAGSRIAMVQISNGNPYYYLSDQIGSTAVVSSGDGKAIQWEADYFPFGSERAVITNLLDNHYQFTGDEFDFETAYNYAVERFQAGRWGRFLSPDILGGSALNPQSLNRYAYVLNNPCTLIDPYGLTPQCTFTVSGGDLSPAVQKEINRILDQAQVQADFVSGSNADVTLVQNETEKTIDPETGDHKLGRTPPIPFIEGGTTSYINNALISQAFKPYSDHTGIPYFHWPSLDLGLARVSAHELAHVFLGPGHPKDNDATNLMGPHDDDIFFPSANNRFQLSEDQKAKILKGCKDIAGRRPPPDDGRDPVFLVPIFPPFLDGCTNLLLFYGLTCTPGPVGEKR